MASVSFAANYTAIQAGFKIFVNGAEFNPSNPAVVIEGRTYLPLRSMGDALGVKVNWNDLWKQVEIGEPPVMPSVTPKPTATPTPLSNADKYKNTCGTLKYRVIIKNIDSHKGEKIKITGKILSIYESSDNGKYTTSLQLDTSRSDTTDDGLGYVVSYNGKINAYKDYRITVWGEIMGPFTYDSALGEQTVPWVGAKYIEVGTK